LIFTFSKPFIVCVVDAASSMKVNPILLAFFLAPIASEMPEILESVSLARKGNSQNINIAMSNLIGGTMSKTTLLCGVCIFLPLSSLWLSYNHNLTISLSKSHYLTISQSHNLTLTQSHTHTLQFHTHTLTITHSHTRNLTMSQSHSHNLTMSQSHSHNLTVTISQCHNLTVTISQSHSYTNVLSHSHSHLALHTRAHSRTLVALALNTHTHIVFILANRYSVFLECHKSFSGRHHTVFLFRF
jgi:Sodium/calcium exchanger protein